MNSKTLLSSAIISIITIVIYHFATQEKVVYVDLVQVYQNYDMNTELNEKIQGYGESQKLQLDQTFLGGKDSTNLDLRKRMYQNKLQNLNDELSFKSEKNRQLVLEKLSEEVKLFCAENNFDLVLGANGTGSILYAKEYRNVTVNFIDYLNKSYNDE